MNEMARISRKTGMTLIELLAVIVIIAILAAMLLSALASAKKRAYEARAKVEVRELTRAWHAYWMTFSEWPSGFDNTEKAMNAANVAYLIGGNSQKIRFLDPTIKVAAEGFKDPWGNFYLVDFTRKTTAGEDVFQGAVYLPLRKRYQYENK